jgi:enamine deaminase RidA (YjgF/YER057c/UK114 family)
MERVVAEADATNVGSLRVIEKLGMRLVGNINAGAPREPYYAVYLAEFRADMGRSKRWSNRAYVSSHVPLDSDGSVVGPFGKVDAEISEEEGYEAARLTALAILASLRRELGDLDRVSAWLRVFGMVNSAPGFGRQPNVINGFSDLILQLYGPEAGDHARSAVGMAGLPLGAPVEIEAEVLVRAD